jgi:hypothetical protein
MPPCRGERRRYGMHATMAGSVLGNLPGPTWVWIVSALVAAAYLGAPLLILATLRVNPEPDLTPMEEGELPQDVLGFLAHQTAELTALGFEPAGYFSVRGVMAGTDAVTYAALLVDADAGDMVGAFAIRQSAGGASTIKNHYVEFTTEFSDGSSVETGNTSELSSFRYGEDKDVLYFPHVRDLRKLHALHGARVREHRGTQETVLPPTDGAGRDLVDGIVRDLERQVAFGDMYREAASGLYRPTVKGAYRMTWQLMPPMGWINKARQRLRGRIEERRLLG